MRIRATAAMAAVLLSAAISDPAQAAHPGQFMDYGHGTSSCGTWLAARTEQPPVQHLSQLGWVLGWVSAAGYYDAAGALRDTDADAIEAWVDKYCRENPLKRISDAAMSLVDELSKPK